MGPDGIRPPQNVADIITTDGPHSGTTYYDVVVSTALRCHAGRWHGDPKGTASARAETAKVRQYAPAPNGRPVRLIPLAAEVGGRWGAHAERTILMLARRRVVESSSDACAAAEGAAAAAVLTRWRQELACVLLRGNWRVVAACTGAAGGAPCSAAPQGAHAELTTYF